MGIITDKLNAEWAAKKIDEDMFAIRAIIEAFKNNASFWGQT